MGANNWATCPKCQKANYAEQTRLLKIVNDAYGEVSVDEYVELRRKANEYDPPDCITFREDYEIGLSSWDGKLHISYHGECEKCGFEKKFDHHE